MSLQLRRGTDTDRLTITPVEGELVYCTDTKLMWVGDGTTVGGVPASSTVTGPSGSNTAYGEDAGISITNTNANQTAIGQYALNANYYGIDNTAVGVKAGQSYGLLTTAGSFVVGVKYKIVSSGDTTFTSIGAANNAVGTVFTATGAGSGSGTAAPDNSVAKRCTFIGHGAGQKMVSGQRNTVVGRGAFGIGVYTNYNTAVGQGTNAYTVGDYNTSLGQNAGQGSGSQNTAIGQNSISSIGYTPVTDLITGETYAITEPGTTNFTTVGAANSNYDTVFVATGTGTGTGIAVGMNRATTTGLRNIGIGKNAGTNEVNSSLTSGVLTKGNDCILIGCNTKLAAGTDNNSTVIGSSAVGVGENTTVIGNSSTVLTKLGGKLVIANAPASSIGAAGDVAGMMSADANYIYHCTGAYDGTTAIWKRIAGSTW